MMASVELPDGGYGLVEMGDPVCGEDFCDGCGDCLACQGHDEVEWCSAGSSRWVIYRTDARWPDALCAWVVAQLQEAASG